MKLSQIIPGIAARYVGRHESPLGSNRGAELAEFFAADSYLSGEHDGGYPWCAAFVCRVIQVAMQELPGPWTFKRPTTPSAFGFEDWSRAQDKSTWTLKPPGRDIESGDIVIFNFSHIGIATSSPDGTGMFMSCEGNTNALGSREGTHVLVKRRSIDSVRCRIRFRV